MLKNKCCLYVIISIRFFSITICNLLIEFPSYFLRLSKQSQFIPLQNVVYFITLPFLVRKILTFYVNDMLLFKCPFPGPKVFKECGQGRVGWGGVGVRLSSLCVSAVLAVHKSLSLEWMPARNVLSANVQYFALTSGATLQAPSHLPCAPLFLPVSHFLSLQLQDKWTALYVTRTLHVLFWLWWH